MEKIVVCPVCLKEYSDMTVKWFIEKIGECQHCDHIRSDDNETESELD